MGAVFDRPSSANWIGESLTFRYIYPRARASASLVSQLADDGTRASSCPARDTSSERDMQFDRDIQLRPVGAVIVTNGQS